MSTVRAQHRLWRRFHSRRHGQLVVRQHDHRHLIGDDCEVVAVIRHSVTHCPCGSTRVTKVEVIDVTPDDQPAAAVAA